MRRALRQADCAVFAGFTQPPRACARGGEACAEGRSQLFPANLRMADGAVAIYFEAAAVITALVLLGQALELRAREKTSGAMKALLGLAPKTAMKVHADGTDSSLQVDAIQVGDLLRGARARRSRSRVNSPRARATLTNRWSPVAGLGASPGVQLKTGTLTEGRPKVVHVEPIGRGRAVPVLRPAALTGGGRCRDGAVFGRRHRQRASPAHGQGGMRCPRL